MEQDSINILGVWLRRVGNEVVVEVWMPNGTYKEVIREKIDGNFSHCCHANGIRESKVVRYPK